MLERRIFDLLDGVQVYCVVICAEFFTLEELDGCLIKLQHNNLVKKTEALDVTIGALDIVCQRCDLVYLAFLRAEKGPERVFAIFELSQSLHIGIPLGDLYIHLLVHLIAAVNSIQDSLEVQYFKLEPATHDSKRVLHL